MGLTTSSQNHGEKNAEQNPHQLSRQPLPPLTRLIYSPVLTTFNKALLDHYPYTVSNGAVGNRENNNDQLFVSVDLSSKRPDLDETFDELGLKSFPLPGCINFSSLNNHSGENNIKNKNCKNKNSTDSAKELKTFSSQALPSLYTLITLYNTYMKGKGVIEYNLDGHFDVDKLTSCPVFPTKVAEYHLGSFFDLIHTVNQPPQITAILREKNRYSNIIPNECYRVPIAVQNIPIVLISFLKSDFMHKKNNFFFQQISTQNNFSSQISQSSQNSQNYSQHYSQYYSPNPQSFFQLQNNPSAQNQHLISYNRHALSVRSNISSSDCIGVDGLSGQYQPVEREHFF